MGFQLLKPPAAEPVSVAELATHLRIAPGDLDTDTQGLLAAYLMAAREWCETFTQRCFITQQWRMYLDAFPGYLDQRLGGMVVTSPVAIGATSYMAGIRWAIVPPFSPVQSIDGLNFLDSNANPVAMVAGTDYIVDTVSNPARVTPQFGKFWPISRIQMNAVWLDWTTGFCDAAIVSIDSTNLSSIVGCKFAAAQNNQPIYIKQAGPMGAVLAAVLTVDGSGNGALSVPAQRAVVNATAFVRWQLPESICIAIKMLAGHYFEQREAYTDVKLIETPAGVKSLLYPYKDLRP